MNFEILVWHLLHLSLLIRETALGSLILASPLGRNTSDKKSGLVHTVNDFSVVRLSMCLLVPGIKEKLSDLFYLHFFYQGFHFSDFVLLSRLHNKICSFPIL